MLCETKLELCNKSAHLTAIYYIYKFYFPTYAKDDLQSRSTKRQFSFYLSAEF